MARTKQTGRVGGNKINLTMAQTRAMDRTKQTGREEGNNSSKVDLQNSPSTDLLQNSSTTRLPLKRMDSSASHLLAAMSGLLNDADTADFTLACGQKEWKLHSPILAVRSSFFRAAIANNKANKLDVKVEIKDRDPEAMQQVINFIYGSRGEITRENVLEIGKLAEFYDLQQLLKNSAEFIVDNEIEMNVDDFVPKLTAKVFNIFKDTLKLKKKESTEALNMSKEMEKDLTKAGKMGKNCQCDITNKLYITCYGCRNLRIWARNLPLAEVRFPGNTQAQPSQSGNYEDSDSSGLLSDMAQLLHDSDTADFTLVCEEKEWQLHSPILAMRSPFFRAAIVTNMTEKLDMKMEIKELDPEAVQQVVNFMYGHPIGEAPFGSLLEASERFQMADMKKEVIKIYSEKITEENVLEIGKLAEFYDTEQLLEETAEFIVKNDIEMKEEDLVPKLTLKVLNTFRRALKQGNMNEKMEPVRKVARKNDISLRKDKTGVCPMCLKVHWLSELEKHAAECPGDAEGTGADKLCSCCLKLIPTEAFKDHILRCNGD